MRDGMGDAQAEEVLTPMLAFDSIEVCVASLKTKVPARTALRERGRTTDKFCQFLT